MTADFLSAALEDAEGHALVKAIHDRKALREVWDYYASIPAPTYDPFKATKAQLKMLEQRAVLVSGRGFGKRAAQIEALRKWNSRPEAFIPHKTPDIGEVRWACKQPTAPVYAEGSYLWAMQQIAARITPAEREHNRKLNERYAAKVSAIHDILGVTQHGSNC